MTIKAQSGDPLTRREVECLTLLAKGVTVKEAARMMGVCPGTAHQYLKATYRKLDAANQCEAVYRAVKEGVIQ